MLDIVFSWFRFGQKSDPHINPMPAIVPTIRAFSPDTSTIRPKKTLGSADFAE
jgi:hypothetical protein